MSWPADAAWSGALVTALTLAGAGCPGPPCQVDSDCEAGHYCAVGAAGSAGQCAQDCNDWSRCPAESFCNSRGRCQLSPKEPTLVLTEPPAVVRGDPGDRFRVAGEVRFLGALATLRMQREDARGCDPVPEVVYQLPGDPGRELTFAFEFPEASLPDGGGTLRVAVELGPFRVEVSRLLEAGELCADCPRLTLHEPTSGSLADRLFFAPLSGVASGFDGDSLRWVVTAEDGTQLSGPIAAASGGQFAKALAPLRLGLNGVAVEASNQAGSARCQRLVETAAVATDLLEVTVGWSSPDADLDLHLVPPGGRYGPGDCSAAVSELTRASGCTVFGDAQAGGPETLVVPQNGALGTYGILVVGFSAPPGQIVRSYVRIISRGRELGAIGPRDLVPARAEIWVVGTVTLAAADADSAFTALDEIIAYAPVRTPETWPPY
ncbi:MAG: hypothetical protein JXR83_19790 [Deltaproteobacteria bacterium]|nr:hypothetical protein [Deltaproteobacteria bacterium]